MRRQVPRAACGHEASVPGLKYCRKCWRERGPEGAKKSYTAAICGHPCSTSRLKYCRECYNKRRKDVVDQRQAGGAVPGDSFSAKGDQAEVSTVTPEAVRTLADLIRVCQIDTTEWIVDRWVANKWEMGAVDPDGALITRPLFQVKAWLKRNVPFVRARQELDALVEDAKAKLPARPKPPKACARGAHMLEVSIPDLHLGKLAWAPETGGANYDSKIASEVFMAALEALIQRTSAFGFERVVFPVGNDFFHADTKQGTTTKGTPLDTDSRFHKTFVAGRRLMTEAIERLRQLAPVTVVVIPGNHDTMSAFHLGDSLECLYHKTPDVTIMNSPIQRKYVSYGCNLIMFTHGDKGKRQNLPLLMATEEPEAFGSAVFREAHTGHNHELRVQESMGVRVRISPALCPADAWHSENHLVGNLRSAEAFVWSKTEGLVATAAYTVREERPQRRRNGAGVLG